MSQREDPARPHPTELRDGLPRTITQKHDPIAPPLFPRTATTQKMGAPGSPAPVSPPVDLIPDTPIAENNTVIPSTPDDPRLDTMPAAPAPARINSVANWAQREPLDTDDRVEHIHTDHHSAATGWQFAGASIRGKLHAHEGRYREDAWEATTTTDRAFTLIAVADGGGSYSLARVGAQIATREAIATLKHKLHGIATATEQFADQITAALAQALDHAAKAVADEATRRAVTKPEITTKDLSTTLLLVAHHPATQHLAIAQVGDGLVIYDQGGQWLAITGESDAGQSAGEVVFLNNAVGDWASRVQCLSLSAAPRFIAAMTDGLADDVMESDHNKNAFARGIKENLHAPAPHETLRKLLGYEKRGSFDDRTLVVTFPDPPAGAR